MNHLRSLIGLFVMSLLVSMGVTAATSTFKPKFKYDAQKDLARYNKGIKYYPVPTTNTTMFADPKAFEQALDNAHKNSRRVAMAKTDITEAAVEAEFSAKFKEMRKDLIGDGETAGIKTKEDLDKLVKKYTDPKEFDAIKAPDAKFFAFQLRALKPAKSFIFRAREYIAKNSASRTMIVSALRAQISGIDNFYPMTGKDKTNYAEILFRYVTEPFPDMEGPIAEDDQFHNFLSAHTEWAEKETNLFQAFAFTMPEFWWDVKVYAPYTNFINEKDRYIKIGYPELLAVYSSALLNLSALYSTTAYSFTGLSAAIQESSGYFGVGFSAAMSTLGVEGLSSRNKFEDVLTQKTPFLFRGTDQTKSRMGIAFDKLFAAVQAGVVAYEDVRGRSADDVRLFESRFVTPALRGSDNSVRGLANLVGLKIKNEEKTYGKDSTEAESKLLAADKANKTVHSMIVGGDVIKVDLQAFYTKPPKNLSDLYPKAWRVDDGNYDEPTEFKVKSWNGQKDVLRNYKYEMAAEWDTATWKTLFPDIEGIGPQSKNTQELGKYVRILSQSWGASAFAMPLTFFVY